MFAQALFATDYYKTMPPTFDTHIHMLVIKTINIAIVNFSFATVDAYRDVPTLHNSAKFIDSSPMNLVEFGTGLFLSKTPSEEAPQDVFSTSGYVMPRSATSVDVPNCNVLPLTNYRP